MAQSTGTVSGQISDNFGPVPMASVKVEGTEIGAYTDHTGKFTLTDVPEGDQKIKVSYLGYSDLLIDVKVVAGDIVDIGEQKITEDAVELEEVVIQTTIKSGQQKALNIQKNSNKIMNVVAADGIGKLPDRNAAEAVQRIPGVSITRDQGEGRYVLVRGTPAEWNSTLINGNRMPTTDRSNRSVPMDLFPSELIQYIELSKALTPDQEGDAIGGSVNFITRTAPAKKTLVASVAGGVHGQSMSEIINASVIYGDRIMNDRLGFILSGATWSRDWASDNYEVVYSTSNKHRMNQLQLRDYLGNRTTWGFNGGLDFKLSKKTKIYAKGLWSDFLDKEERRRTRFRFDKVDSVTADGMGLDGRVEHALTHTHYHSRFYGAEVGAVHNMSNKVNIDWNFSSYKAKFWYDSPTNVADDDKHGYFYTTFIQNGIDFENFSPEGEGMYLAADAPDGIGVTDFDNIQPGVSSNTPVDASEAIFTSAIASGRQISERDVTGQANLNLNASERLDLKFGLKFRNKNRISDRLQTAWTSSSDIAMSDIASEEFPVVDGFLTEHDQPYDQYLVPYPTIEANDNIVTRNDITEVHMGRDHPKNATTTLKGTENVTAYYGMGEFKALPKLMLIGGVRVEHTAISYESFSVDEDDNVTPIDGSSNYVSVLPMLHAKMPLKDKWNLRAAVTRTFARPNFTDVTPSRSISNGDQEIEQGNPDLKPTYAMNYDILTDYYFKDVGQITAGVFYKSIDDVIFGRTGQQTIDGTFFTVTQPENAEKAWLAGFEVGIMKRFTFLPGFWSGFGFNGNYTFTDSEVQVPGREEKQTLPGQSKHTWNAILFYEKYGFSARLAVTLKGKFLDEIQGSSSDQDRWYDDNLNVDFTAAYTISSKIRVFLELNNLLNSPLRYYHGHVDRPEQVEYYAPKGQAGIRISIL